MTNGKQISFLSIIIIAIVAAATSGCSQSPCDDVAWAAENRDVCPLAFEGDGGMNPDSSMMPDGGGTGTKPVIVEGLIYETGVGTVSNVNVIDGDVANVLVAACDITSRPARGGWRPFRCEFNIAIGQDFNVRYSSPGRINYAAVTNYNLTTPVFADNEFLIAEVKDGGTVWNWDNYHRVKFDGSYRDIIATPATRPTATTDNSARLRL